MHKCNCEHCELRTPCLICGEEKIDRAHIIPGAIIHELEEGDVKEKWGDINGHNIMPLCREHHQDYDLFRTSKRNLDIIKDYVGDKLMEFYEEIENVKVSGYFAIKSKKWLDKVEKWLNQMQAEDHYLMVN